MFYVYVIRNRRTGELYIGYTEDLERRLREHKPKNPELIYYEAYKSRIDAQNRERKLKQRGQSMRWLKSRIRHSLEK
jgi:putative endonuclease